jgi:hypothetical protein
VSSTVVTSPGDGFLSRHAVDFVLSLFALMCVVVIVYSIGSAQRIADIQQAQVDLAIQQNQEAIEQNEQALCNQHDMIVAIKLLGDRLHILKIDDIIVPDITGLECS